MFAAQNKSLMKKTILALSLLATLFTACKKDDDEEPAQITPTKENLTASYKMTAMTWAGVNVFNNANESSNLFEPCERDDVYQLKSDFTATLTDAGTVCSPSNSGTGLWSLSGTTITIEDLGSMDIDGTIKSWNGQTLVIEDNSAGFAISATFQKQ
jgi:hypothetical protein